MKKNNITVVIVNDFDYIQGGASKVALDTASILNKKGINTIFFSATHKDNEYEFMQICTNQKECLNDGLKGAIRSINNLKVKKEFSKLLDTLDNKNTIIHVHGWTKSLSSIIFKVAHERGFKLLLTIHDYFTVCPNGGFYNYKKDKICDLNPMTLKCITCNCDSRNYAFKLFRILRQIRQNKNTNRLQNIDYVISISDFSISKIQHYFNNNTFIRKIYNPIPIKKENIINIKNNKNYIYVGRVTKEKGVDIFCEAIEKLNLKGIVIGDGEERKSLEKRYKKIKFVGWQNSSDVKKYMKDAKCLIFPSKWYEGAPLTILEALSLGLPCIVSNKCAGTDFVTDEENGLIFDGTANDLVNKIEKYEKINIIEISKKSYKKYWDNPFNEERYYKELIRYYNYILKGE